MKQKFTENSGRIHLEEKQHQEDRITSLRMDCHPGNCFTLYRVPEKVLR